MNDQLRHALETIASRGPDPGATEVWQHAFEAAPKRRRRRRVRVTVAGATAILVIAGLAIVLRGAPSGVRHLVVSTPTTAEAPVGSPLRPVTVIDRVVEGTSSVEQVALGADGGVWFIYRGALKLLDAAGAVTVVHLPKGFTVIQDTVSPQLTVDPDGTVWLLGYSGVTKANLGISLAEVAPGASHAKLIELVKLPDNRFGPTDAPEPPAPSALASDGAGHVALALSGTSIVRVYNSRNGSFTGVQLPKATDASALRYFGDGKLAIGLVRIGEPETTAVIADPDGSRSRQIEVGDSTVAKPYGNTAVLFGDLRPTILDSDGTTHAVALPPGVSTAADFGGVQAGHNDTLVVATFTGIAFVDRRAGSVITTYEYRIGDVPCGPDSGTGAIGPTAPAQVPTGGCLVPPRVAVSPDGAVWVFNMVWTQRGIHFLVQRIDRY